MFVVLFSFSIWGIGAVEPDRVVTVSGRIADSVDPQQGLEGAFISLMGSMNYAAVTDTLGQFSIQGVEAGTYTYQIMLEGYNNNTGTIMVANTALNMGTMLLVRYALAPTDVQAVENNMQVYLNWNHPVTEPVFPAYKVWRLHPGEEQNESVWVSLTPNPITATAYVDINWFQMPELAYKWAVKAIYLNNVVSPPAFSNSIFVPIQVGTVSGFVMRDMSHPIVGATVSSEGYSTTTDNTGHYNLNIFSGHHDVTASHPSFEPLTITDVLVVSGQTTSLQFNLTYHYTSTFQDGFETYPDFAIEFSPWTLVDVDMSETYAPDGISFPNLSVPKAFIIFNPSSTVPPLTNISAHSGSKMAACFAAGFSPNNDWLITPMILSPLELRFFARSYALEYGLNSFQVGVSTTETAPQSFIDISGYVTNVPDSWTEYTYDLSAYFNQAVYIGIRCSSIDAMALLIDDLIIEPNGAVDDPAAPEPGSCLTGNYPNPFTSATTISYRLAEPGKALLEIFNTRGQKVRSLVNETGVKGDHSAFWDGLDAQGKPTAAGVYICRLQAGKRVSSRKMILLR